LLVLEYASVNCSVNECVREFLQPALYLIELQPEGMGCSDAVRFSFFLPFFQVGV